MGFGWKNPLKTVQEVAQATTEKANSILTGGTNAVNNAGSTAGKGYKGIAERVAAAIEKQKEGIRLAMEQAQAAAKDPAKYTDDTKDSIIESATSVAKDNNMDKPGGTIGEITDAMNPSNSVDDQVGVIETAVNTVFDPESSIYNPDGDETDEDTPTKNTLLTDAGLNDPGSEENEDLSSGNTKKRTANFSRNQSNLTVNQNSSLLT
tara:strand:+ start:933 stop:1553 length:621 start_codon:yes stop_codon:yes gene_type:complete